MLKIKYNPIIFIYPSINSDLTFHTTFSNRLFFVLETAI